MIYDYVSYEKRTGALALTQTVSGFAGFFTTLIVSPLVSNIQENGNTFLGLNIYAQQVVSVMATIFVGVLLLYLNMVVKKIKDKRNECI